MRDCNRSRSRIGFLCALLLAALASPQAWAQETAPTCEEECGRARHVCVRAARHAHRECHASCGQIVERVIRRVRAVCRDEGLAPDECADLVERSVAAATEACFRDCRRALRRAKHACQRQVLECRVACAPVEPECRDACTGDFSACTESLDACLTGCRAETDAEREACRDADEPAACADQVVGEARECAGVCHDVRPCGSDLRMCLAECPVVE